MAATASNAGSVAVLKRKYPAGALPKANFQKFPFMSMVDKKEDFNGDDYSLPLQTENPQGVGHDIPSAQDGMQQGAYSRFLLTRQEYYGVARVKGQAYKTAVTKGGGAVVDLWANEVEGIQQTVLKMLEIFAFGTGNGVLATISSGATTTTLTLTTPEDINLIDSGAKLGAVSDTTLSPTVRVGAQVVTGIDRVNGTVTGALAWNVAIAGLVNGDSLVRNGDAAIAGAATVLTGMRQWYIGGSSPGTLFGLPRNADPVRLAGQVTDLTGLPMESALIDEESLLTIQGQTGDKTCWVNPRDIRQMKKSMGSKITLPRTDVKSQTIGISFKGFELISDSGSMPLMTSPFCPKLNNFMVPNGAFALYSAGAAPSIINFDGLEALRVATDDAMEVRVGLYGNFGTQRPVEGIRGINWGN